MELNMDFNILRKLKKQNFISLQKNLNRKKFHTMKLKLKVILRKTLNKNQVVVEIFINNYYKLIAK